MNLERGWERGAQLDTARLLSMNGALRCLVFAARGALFGVLLLLLTGKRDCILYESGNSTEMEAGCF
jgi:hypothetical protein